MQRIRTALRTSGGRFFYEGQGGGPRTDAANYAIAPAKQGMRSSVVRLSRMVHSDLDHHGFTHPLIGFARENRTGDGSNRWPANTYDIGVLYRLAVERAPADSTLHGVGDTGIRRKVIARRSPASSVSRPGASHRRRRPSTSAFSPRLPGSITPTSNDKTRELLGWEPTHPGWVEDVRTGHYFG